MKILELSNSNKVALLDDEDYFEIVKLGLTWCESTGSVSAKKKIYVKGMFIKRVTVHLHRVILGLSANDKIEVDHIDMDWLNNRRSNLRLATHSQNGCNKNSNNKHGYKGIYYCPKVGAWYAKIKLNGEQISLGRHATKEAAALAYNEGARKFHGEFAKLNIVQ